MEYETKTIAAHAVDMAQKTKSNFIGRAAFTGRVLVKEGFENATTTKDDDDEIFLYAVPELKRLSRVILNSILKRGNVEPELTMRRVLYLNDALKNGGPQICIYDAHGKVERG